MESVYDTSDQPIPLLRLAKRQGSSSGRSSQVPLPRAFDSNLGNNFTSPSCPAFFQSFLTNPTFQECLPLSLLLQTSNGFFSATRSLAHLTRTLDGTCKADYHQCSTLMASLAEELQLENNCGADLQMQNPLVMQAHNGFVAYQPLFHAGCLRDQNGNYCFAKAVTRSEPTSSYIYFLPLGFDLPKGGQPTCDSCLHDTLALFASYADNSSRPLSSGYTSAAQQVDAACGPRFVEATVQSSAAPLASDAPRGLSLLFLSIALLRLLL